MKDTYDILCELQGISAQLYCIRCPFEDRETMQSVCLPAPKTLYNAIFGIEEHIDRLVEDLARIDTERCTNVRRE